MTGDDFHIQFLVQYKQKQNDILFEHYPIEIVIYKMNLY